MTETDFDSLQEPVSALIDSGLRGSPVAHASDVDAVLERARWTDRPLDRSTWSVVQRAGFSAAVARSLLYSGHANAAVKAADDAKGYLREAATEADPGFLSRCYGLLSESYLLGAHARESSEMCHIGLDLASQADDEPVRFRVRGLLAASLAVGGEFGASTKVCKAIYEENPALGSGALPWSIALARLMVGRRKFDRDTLREVVASPSTSRHVTLMSDSVRSLGRGWLASLEGDHRKAIAEMETFTHGVLGLRHPPLFTGLALEIEAWAFLQFGQADKALSLLAGRPSLPDHTVCFGVLRATAELQMNRPREALRTTERCLRAGPVHCLRSLPAVHVRRAVAYDMLHLEDPADKEFSQASHLAFELGAVGSVPGVVFEQVRALFLRFRAKEPEFAGRFAQKIPPEGIGEGLGTPRFQSVRLTHRETRLANWLSTELTLVQIARELVVSINTVKSQQRSLYKKLGVTSRTGAVDRLASLGLVHDPRTTDRSNR